MNRKIAETITELRKHSVYNQLPYMADLLTLLAEEQAESAAKMEKQTEKIINLTNKLVHLTWGLLLLTAVLCYIAVAFK